jgi:hypothetical protein
MGLGTLLWSVDCQDWASRTSDDARLRARQILSEAVGGDVVLLHDNHSFVLDLLDVVLPPLAERFDLASAVDAI